MLIKTDSVGYMQDVHTKAIINTNDTEYKRVLSERQRAKLANKLEGDVATLKNELTEIKDLLSQLINGKCNG